MQKVKLLSVTRTRILVTNTLLLAALSAAPATFSSVQAQQTAPATAAAPTEPVPDTVRFASEINAYQAADRQQMPPKNAVLFIGSSSIRLWDTLAKDFAEIPVINRGFGGSFIEESTLHADRIAIPYAPKIIVVGAGTNDVAEGKNAQQVLQEFKDFVAKIRPALPDTRIVYISINPTVSRWNHESTILETNYLIERYIFENNSPTNKLTFINSHSGLLTPDGQPQPHLLQPDMLHLNPEGYKVWASILKPRILALATLDGVQRLDTPKN